MTPTVTNTAIPTVTPDYRLTGEAKQRAFDAGLANAEWFQPAIDRARLAELQTRTDARASFDTLLWIALLVGAGVWAYLSVWSWWSIPAFLTYGALFGGAADARWHEMGHGTAFRTRWLNDAVYPVASAMLFRGPTLWRWSHYGHHTDTIIVGRDAEIAVQRPANVARTLLFFTGKAALPTFVRLVRHSLGRLDTDATEVVPAREHRRVVWESRAIVASVVAASVWALATWSPVPILFVGGPTIYGQWLMIFFGLTQHAAMRENVLDHRFNTRTVLMNPVFRFLYLNMNYHVEHHIFPSVPYRALPQLHEEIKSQLAPALPNTLATYRQIFTTLARQQRNPSYELDAQVPEVASATRHRIDVGGTLDSGPVDLGAVDALVVGQMARRDVGGRTFVLCRLGEDEFAVGDGLCTHGAVHLVDGALAAGLIECPKHNGRFDARTGQAVRKPATEALCMYPVRRVGDRLVSEISPPGTDHQNPLTMR